MDTRKMRCGLLAVVGMVAPAFADPIWSVFPGGDAGYDALTANGNLEQGTVEGRIGNRLDTGTWELAIWRRVNAGPFLNLGQLTWPNGVAAPFTITYDGNSTLTYMLGAMTISTTQMGGTFSEIFIRTHSARNGSVALTQMRFVGGISLPTLASMGDGTTDYIRVTNMGQAFPAFVITGFETLSWNVNDPPQNSNVSGQFRFANIVPAPGGVACIAACGLIAIRRRR